MGTWYWAVCKEITEEEEINYNHAGENKYCTEKDILPIIQYLLFIISVLFHLLIKLIILKLLIQKLILGI